MDNETMMQFFEWNLPPDGLLWDRAAGLAGEIKDAGVDILWMPPAYKGAGGMQDRGYGAYDLYDLGEFDQKGSVNTKYGSRESYLRAVAAAHGAGLSVLGDVVLNHKMGADGTEDIRATRVNPGNREEKTDGPLDISSWTKYIFPGRAGKYSEFQWDWQCFTGVDWDAKTNQPGVYLLEGKQWNPHVSGENGNYDYLMGADVDFTHEAVAAELENWGRWYLDTTHVDGFRLDAVKHMDYDYPPRWLAAMRQHAGKNLFAVGEYWNADAGVLQQYLAHTGYCMSLFDVPLHFRLYEASRAGGNYDMGSLLQNTLIEADTIHTVTFVENHDSQPGAALASPVEEWFKPLAYALILLRLDGLPCVFYPDFFGRPDDGVPGVAGLRRMLHIRKRYAYGPQHDYFDHTDIVGWTREGDGEHPDSGLAVLLTDRGKGEKQMYIGKQFAGKEFREAIRRMQQPVTVDENGNATFLVEGGGVSVWLTGQAYTALATRFD